jgi:NodT family efflux transporter outer membrane factor (OMF) lipoprotein
MRSIRFTVRSGAATTALGLALTALAGCAPNLGPAPQLAAVASLSADRSLTAPHSDWPPESWWSAYGDPQLNAIEDEAVKDAPTLRAAEARVRKAEALAQQAGAPFQPQLSGDAFAQGLQQTLNQGFPKIDQSLLPRGLHDQEQIAANLSYQLDFFGRNRAALAAATSDAEAARADAAEAHLQLSTAVATTYAELGRLFALRDAALDAVKVQQTTLTLVAERRSTGLASRVDYSQQAALVPAAEGQVEAIDRQIEITRHQLAALMGAGPDRGLAIIRPSAAALRPLGVPASLKLDLIGRRPDLVAARLRTEAAASRVNVARLDYYPNVELTAYGGVQSLGIATLLDHTSVIGAFGPALHVPIFTGGRLEGAYRGARADYDEAVAQYDGVLTDALRDIANVISAQRSFTREMRDAQASLAAATDAYDAAKIRYSAGLTGLVTVLVAENTLIDQRRHVADLQSQFLSLDIALVRALGGGFNAAPASARAN